MISPYVAYEIAGEPFRLFSASHVIAIGLLICAAVLLYLYRNPLRRRFCRLGRYMLAAVLLATEVFFQLWHYFTGSWSAEYALPLQLCSVSLLLSVVMLVLNSYRLFEITYFAGLGGAGQAMLTPELFYPFPHVRFFHFFIAHGAIILACLYMTWVEGHRPRFRSVWKALLALNGLLLIALWVNRLTGGNYLFVSHKPYNPSLLDYLGPYPWYILSLEAVACLVFCLLYLPFGKRQTAAAPKASDRVTQRQ